MKGKKPEAARDRILAAAEELFATRGVHGTSLREIARQAGINVNLISYYFAEKHDMYDAVVDARATLLNEARASSLDALEARFSPHPVPVEELVRSLIHPFFAYRTLDPKGWTQWLQLLDRETGTELFQDAMRRNLAVVLRRYLNSMHRTLPGARRSDLTFVLELATRAMIMGTFWNVDIMISDEGTGYGTPDEAEDRIVQSITAAALSFSQPG